MQMHKTPLVRPLSVASPFRIAPAVGCALFLAGCFGAATSPPVVDDAGYGAAPDYGPLCTGNNDGIIDRAELQFPVGVTVRYLVNPPGTTVPVSPAGTPGPDGPVWDLSSTAGEVRSFTLKPVAGAWFEGSFPGATYAIVTDLQSGTLGVFRVTDDAVLLLGFVSEEPNRTLLVYDAPVATLRFPVKAGAGWVTGGRVTNGKLDGKPFASTDTYRVSVDARGQAVLPFLKFANTLRVRVDLSQALPAGVSINRIQYLYYHECFGELGRFSSAAGETDPAFTTAAESRRLAL